MRGVISAGDRVTAEAGAEILRRGGNAFDAVIAALATAPHSEPMLSSLGGGGFLLSAKKGEEPVLYDFFVDVPPKRLDIPDFFPIYVDFGNAVQEFHIGAGSTAVPGVIAGIEKVHSELGSIDMKDILSPAIKASEDGIYLSEMQASFVKLLEPILLSTEESASLYTPNGRLIDHIRLFKNTEYADFLKRLSKEGAKIFYSGDTASEIDRLYREREGLLSAKELSEYRVEKRKPISLKYRGRDIYTNPPPSAGGILIAFTLKMLENGSYNSAEDIEYLIDLVESFAVTGEFRATHIDPNIHTESITETLNDERLLSHYSMSRKSRINLWGNTTHISVIDSEGNCASATITNGEGSGIIIPGTGIMMNNMLGEEDLNPHGFFGWEAGVRLPSMMSPTMAFEQGRPLLILGSAGSNRIRSAVTQVLERYITYGEEISDSVKSHRLHYEKEKLFLEPGFDTEFVKRVKERYDTTLFDDKSLFFGGVNAVTGDMRGAADERRGGISIIVD